MAKIAASQGVLTCRISAFFPVSLPNGSVKVLTKLTTVDSAQPNPAGNLGDVCVDDLDPPGQDDFFLEDLFGY